MFLLHLISFTNTTPTTPTSELLIETAFPRGNEQIANHGLRIDEENVGCLVCVFVWSKCHDHPMSEIRFSRATTLPETNIAPENGWLEY